MKGKKSNWGSFSGKRKEKERDKNKKNETRKGGKVFIY